MLTFRRNRESAHYPLLALSRAISRRREYRRGCRASRRLFKHEIESYNTRPAVAEQFFLFNASSPAAVCLSRSFLNCVPSLARRGGNPHLPPLFAVYFLLKGQRVDAEILLLVLLPSHLIDRKCMQGVHSVECIDHVYCCCLVTIGRVFSFHRHSFVFARDCSYNMIIYFILTHYIHHMK